MDRPRPTTRRIITGVLFLLALAVVLIFSYRHYFRANTQDTSDNNTIAPESTNSISTEEQTDQNNTETNDPDFYYNNSVVLANQGKYSEAITEISKAILLDNQNEIYWSKKASYYALANDSANEIKTLQEGLIALPNSELLKTKLDLVNQDIGFDGGGVRE